MCNTAFCWCVFKYVSLYITISLSGKTEQYHRKQHVNLSKTHLPIITLQKINSMGVDYITCMYLIHTQSHLNIHTELCKRAKQFNMYNL